MNIETLLHKEIKSELEELKKTQVGSDDHTKGVDGVAKLMDRAIEMEKLNLENEKEEEGRKDRLIRNCISIGGIVLPIVVTIWGTLKTLKFEETGTVTTIMGRGFINKLLPKK